MGLTKLKIEAYKDSACTLPPAGSMDVMFNPESYTRNYQTKYSEFKAFGQKETILVYEGMLGNDMTLKLIADGTGIVPLPNKILNVDGYIEKIKNLIHTVNGDVKRPNVLKIVWGKLSLVCVCKNLNITYTLFKPDGTALRATIELVLSESTDFIEKKLKDEKDLPSLTKVETVRPTDTLADMCFRIYGDSSYYLEVAKINNLDSINAIKPGDKLTFPPIKK
jgi:hypothetical protein